MNRKVRRVLKKSSGVVLAGTMIFSNSGVMALADTPKEQPTVTQEHGGLVNGQLTQMVYLLLVKVLVKKLNTVIVELIMEEYLHGQSTKIR